MGSTMAEAVLSRLRAPIKQTTKLRGTKQHPEGTKQHPMSNVCPGPQAERRSRQRVHHVHQLEEKGMAGMQGDS
jgi:hypothetical protein